MAQQGEGTLGEVPAVAGAPVATLLLALHSRPTQGPKVLPSPGRPQTLGPTEFSSILREDADANVECFIYAATSP